MENNLNAFLSEIRTFVDKDAVYTDDLRRFAWGTDAGFYRLVPKVVVRPSSEAQVAAILKAAFENNVPVTFRAAGTSLSGQSVSDSVLVVAGKIFFALNVISADFIKGKGIAQILNIRANGNVVDLFL